MSRARRAATRIGAVSRRAARGMPDAASSRSRPVLAVVATLLALSAAARVGDGVSHALAEETAASPEASAPEASAPDACAPAPETADLLAAIRLREEDVDRRESELADRALAVETARQEVETRLAALVAAEESLARTVSIADEAAEKDIARLVTMYENMKPKEAAPLFEEMAPDFAAGFLARMRPDAAAAILSGIAPKKAYTISAVLAGRNVSAPLD